MDYRDFEKGSATEQRKHCAHWWKDEEGPERANRVVQAGKSLQNEGNEREQANLRHARLYGSTDLLGFGMRDYVKYASSPTNRIAFNVIASCIDTLTAKIGKNNPRPSFQTDGANFQLQRRAKRLDKFGRALFYETKFYQHYVRAFVDALIFGTGFLHCFMDSGTGRVKVERCFPGEIYVDDADGLHGEPRQLIRMKPMAREVLAEMFPEHAEKIASAPAADQSQSTALFGDAVEVWEAWHLPSGKDAGDGKHIIAIDGCELFAEEYAFDYFPFVILRYKPRVLGFWGQGLAEELTGIQREINRLLQSVSEQLRRKGRGRIFVQVGSKVVPSHLTNNIADIVHYVGSPPVVDSSNHVAQEEFAQLDRLIRYAYQLAGISEMSAGSKKPAGLDAAVAMREFSEIESERFALTGKMFEQGPLDAMRIMLNLIRANKAKGYKSVLAGKHSTEVLDWRDIDLDEDTYTMQMFPVSSLPQTPSARKAFVTELVQEGYLPDKAVALRLLDFPDIEAENSLFYAGADAADQLISDILDAEEPKLTPPSEFDNLPLLTERARAAYLRARSRGAEDERLDLLIELIDKCVVLMNPPPPPTPDVGMEPPMDPAMGGPPGMPPPGMMPPGMPPGAPAGAPLINAPNGLMTSNVNVEAPGPAPAIPPLVG